MSKLAAVFAIAAVLGIITMSILPSSEARPITTILSATSLNQIALPAVSEKAHDQAGVCNRREKEEDCLIRRTLEAHTDYIYSGDTKP